MRFDTLALVGQPISLPDLRGHLRIDPPDEASPRDTALLAMLAGAVQLAQGYAGTALCAQQMRVFDTLPADATRLLLPMRCDSVETLSLLIDGAWQVQDPASISITALGGCNAVHFAPATGARAIELTIQTPAQSLDDGTRSALLLIVANLERNAGDAEGFDPLTPAVRQLLQPRKLDWSAA